LEFDTDQFPIHSRMASLDEEIAALEAEIEGYEMKLNDATSSVEDIRIWAGLIKSCRENLTELKKRRNAQAAGNPICFD
jgi:hypothetical protein